MSIRNFFYALETTNDLVFRIKTDLNEDDIFNIALSIVEVTFEWDKLKYTLGLSKILKLHVYSVHCLEFAIKHKSTPASYGEQDGEMLHRRFRQTHEVYKTMGKNKGLLHAVKAWNSCNFD